MNKKSALQTSVTETVHRPTVSRFLKAMNLDITCISGFCLRIKSLGFKFRKLIYPSNFSKLKVVTFSVQ